MRFSSGSRHRRRKEGVERRSALAKTGGSTSCGSWESPSGESLLLASEGDAEPPAAGSVLPRRSVLVAARHSGRTLATLNDDAVETPRPAEDVRERVGRRRRPTRRHGGRDGPLHAGSLAEGAVLKHDLPAV